MFATLVVGKYIPIHGCQWRFKVDIGDDRRRHGSRLHSTKFVILIRGNLLVPNTVLCT
jgi:hypothetical protein